MIPFASARSPRRFPQSPPPRGATVHRQRSSPVGGDEDGVLRVVDDLAINVVVGPASAAGGETSATHAKRAGAAAGEPGDGLRLASRPRQSERRHERRRMRVASEPCFEEAASSAAASPPHPGRDGADAATKTRRVVLPTPPFRKTHVAAALGVARTKTQDGGGRSLRAAAQSMRDASCWRAWRRRCASGG